LTNPPAILIAGAGWRIWRFVVPALLNEGVRAEQITILRRSSGKPDLPMLRGIRMVTNLDALKGEAFTLTMNCVLAPSLVAIERDLIARLPGATHLCDTPIFDAPKELGMVRSLRGADLHSLEDWPYMPNLAYFAGRMRSAQEGALTVEHFGVPGHFLSLYRAVHGSGWSPGRRVTRADTRISGMPGPGLSVAWQGPKDFSRAKVSYRTASSVVEDFHEVETRRHDNGEVLYRLVEDGTVRYCVGETEVSAHAVTPELRTTFEPLTDRKNVHEFDKFVALTTVFRGLLGAGAPSPYSYLDSAKDALAARRLGQREVAWLT
jgi:hypothetical protein